MAEVLVEFSEPVVDEAGVRYLARACGGPMDNETERWQGWIEFVPLDGGEPLRSSRETTQPNRVDTLYWATGLTAVYLEGALNRTLKPLTLQPAPPPPRPAFDEPAPPVQVAPPATDSVLNPFSVYRKGEALLRQQLGALSAWHLVNIVRAYGLSALQEEDLARLSSPELIELIVQGVKIEEEEPTRR